jgi:hypothetical protein
MSLFKTWLWLSLGSILMSCLVACSPDSKGISFDYLREARLFRADTTLTRDSSLCGQSNPFGTMDECLSAKKYKLTWKRPEDSAKLLGYRIYLDTAHNDMSWNNLRNKPELASIIVDSKAAEDTIVFVFGNKGFAQDSIKHGQQKIVVVDTSDGRAEKSSGKLVFALVSVYGGDRTPGSPQYSYFKTTDKDPPDPFHPRIKPMATEIEVSWQRPTDLVNFFDPSQDTGLIQGYRLEVSLNGRLGLRGKDFKPQVGSYLVGGKEMAGSVTDSLNNDSLPTAVTFRLPDSNRATKRTTPLPSDSLHFTVKNLKPQDSLTVFLYAIDANGNKNEASMEKVTVFMTDTTQPSKPVLSITGVGRNGFTARWTASRDSVRNGESRDKGPTPNFRIDRYLLTRILLRAPGEKTTSLDRIDTVITTVPSDSIRDTFTVEMKYLPPGTPFHLRLTAVDITGFESATDTISTATDAVRFSGADSALACPAGFIPIPRGSFRLGDDSPTASADEKGRIVNMGPYCIEPYEHRETGGKRFVSNVTYEQAEKACEDIDASFETRLCSEAEWERACEGPFTDDQALLHGIQSENKNPSILQSSCNQGTSDSAMAMSFELRNAVCLTTEGVYDMAGNLSEWVRDPYVATAYASADSVMSHDFAFSDSTGPRKYGYRGGNYLTRLPLLSATQALARCSNRDYAQQSRPKFKSECVDADKAKIAVIYGPELSGHRCVPIPGRFNPDSITDFQPSLKDTSGRTLYVFLAGKVDPDTVLLPLDSAFKGKPASAMLTKRALAVVTFEKTGGSPAIEDTLDATEMKDTTQESLDRIFKREASNPEWSVRKEGGKYKIKYLYAYTLPGARPAREYYSSRAIGFRCCSKAKSP